MNLFINGRFLTQNVTGVQRYAYEIIRAFDEMHTEIGKPDITVLSPKQNAVIQTSFKNINIQRVGTHSGHLWEQIDLPKHARNRTLFCPGNTAPIFSLFKQPTIVTVHDLSYRYFPAAYSRKFRYAYKILMPIIMTQATKIITVSKSEQSSITKVYPKVAGRISAIQNGGFGSRENTVLRTILPKSIGRPFGLYVGSLSRRKNFPALLEAAKQFVAETDYSFVFVGGAGASFRAAKAEIPPNLTGRLIFTGQIDDQTELLAWYKGADFFAFPSLYEASPFPPIEAMSAGLPVIAGDIPSLNERCGNAALYCDPENAELIAGKMMLLANDRGLHAKLKNLGYRRAELFSWHECARRTWNIIQECVDAQER